MRSRKERNWFGWICSWSCDRFGNWHSARDKAQAPKTMVGADGKREENQDRDNGYSSCSTSRWSRSAPPRQIALSLLATEEGLAMAKSIRRGDC